MDIKELLFATADSPTAGSGIVYTEEALRGMAEMWECCRYDEDTRQLWLRPNLERLRGRSIIGSGYASFPRPLVDLTQSGQKFPPFEA